jgi:hypothetical protein
MKVTIFKYYSIFCLGSSFTCFVEKQSPQGFVILGIATISFGLYKYFIHSIKKNTYGKDKSK